MFPFLRNTTREAKKGQESFRERKIKVHNSHKPLKPRTLIYWHNKNYIFLCVASFRSKIYPLLPKWLWLSVIKALNTLKPFYRRSQDLHSRLGFNSFRGKDQMSRRSSIHSLGRRVQFFFPLLEEIFTIYNVLNRTTQPTATLISAIRWWMRFRRHLQS